MGRLTLVALTALAWLAITATAARAATVFIHEGLLEFVGETGENNRVTISRDGDVYRVTDRSPSPPTIALGPSHRRRCARSKA